MLVLVVIGRRALDVTRDARVQSQIARGFQVSDAGGDVIYNCRPTPLTHVTCVFGCNVEPMVVEQAVV